MCTQLLSASMSAATAASTGQSIQAAAGAVGALGDLAAGMTRARLARLDAEGERAVAEARARRIRAAGERELGRARSDAVAAGVSVRSESVLEAERQIGRGVEQDAGVALLTGESRANSLELAASGYRAAGLASFGDGLLDAASKWKRSRASRAADIWSPGYDDRGAITGGWTGDR